MTENHEEEKDTSLDSPSEEQTADSDTAVDQDVKEDSSPQKQVKLTEEEASWKQLSGSSQERFKAILAENRRLREIKAEQARIDSQTVPPSNAPYNQDEVELATRVLKERGGFVTKDEITSYFGSIEKSRQHESLANKYNGSDGGPKYDPDEVEDYARRRGLGNMEDAFKAMYFDEFQDIARKNARSEKRKIVTEKPESSTSGLRQPPLTLESFKKKLSGPDGRQFYDKLAKNPAAFDALMEQFSKQ